MVHPEARIDGLEVVADISVELQELQEFIYYQHGGFEGSTKSCPKGMSAINHLVSPIANLTPDSIDIWEVATGLVNPGTSQKLASWHNFEDYFYISCNALPTEILVARKGKAHSCRGEDIDELLVERTQDHHPIGLSDKQLVALGIGIISILPGLLYRLSGQPYHRGVTNTSAEPILRTSILGSDDKLFVDDTLPY